MDTLEIMKYIEKQINCETLFFRGFSETGWDFCINNLIFTIEVDEMEGEWGKSQVIGAMLSGVRSNEDKYYYVLATVTLQCDDEYVYLIDASDNHCWLKFGTDYSDSYYPSASAQYTPKSKEKIEEIDMNGTPNLNVVKEYANLVLEAATLENAIVDKSEELRLIRVKLNTVKEKLRELNYVPSY